MWHLSHESLDLEDSGNEPQYDKAGFLELGVSPKTAPDKSEFVELEFEQGMPVALNGEKLKPAPSLQSSTRSADATASACTMWWRIVWWA